MSFQILDPTPEKAPPVGQLAPRVDTLEGKTIGFISNGKEGTKGFFRHLDRILREEICSRSDDGDAPMELSERTKTIIRTHGWLAS